MKEWLTTSTVLDGLGDFGNHVAWSQFADRFRAPIVSFARKLGLPAAEAEDVAQETMVAFADAFRRGEYDRTKGRLSNWLFGIAFRQAAHARRKLARREAQIGGGSDGTSFWSALPDENAAAESWDRQWHDAMLKHCLKHARQSVEPVTFQAFDLVVMHKRPPAEVAAELGITRNAVFIAKHRVLKRIRQLRREYESTI